MSPDPNTRDRSRQIDDSTAAPPARLGVIASMKRGLEHFVYRDVCSLEKQGFEISLFPTKHARGLYNPPASWRVARWTLLGVLLSQPAALLRAPSRYLAAFATALRFGAVVDFLMAAHFAAGIEGVDAIYSTFGDRKLFVGYFAKRLTGKPLLCMIHAYELYDNPNPRLFPIALADCDQVMTISRYNREKIATLLDRDPAEIEVVRCSIDLQEYRPREKFVVLIVGFFVERKGHRVLFEALKSLGDPDVEVWVVGGEGAEADSVDVRALAAEHGVEDRVAFFGRLAGPALRAVYHAADVFCLPCHFDSHGVGEGFPSVIIEAMACGKPVISTRHVAIPEVLRQIVVDEKDAAGLADALRRCKESPELLDGMGQESRELAEQHFGVENIDRTAAIVRRLCGRTLPEPNAGHEPAGEATAGEAPLPPVATQH